MVASSSGSAPDGRRPSTTRSASLSRRRVQRVDLFEQALDVIVDLLEGRTVSANDLYTITDATLGVTTVQIPRPPILIGAFRPRMLAIAARRAEIVQLTGLALDGEGGVTIGDASWDTAVAEASRVRELAGRSRSRAVRAGAAGCR